MLHEPPTAGSRASNKDLLDAECCREGMLHKWKTQETVQSAAGTDVNTDARGGGGGEGRSTAAFRPDDHKKLHGDHSNGPKNNDAGTNTSGEGQQFQRTTWALAKHLPPPTLVVAEAPFISANATNPAGRYCGLTAAQVPTACTTQGSERSAAGATQNRTKFRRGRSPASITEMALFIVGGVFGIIVLVALIIVATVAERKKRTAHRPGWWSWPRLIPRRPPRSIKRSYWVVLIFWRPFFFATAIPKGTLTDSEFKLATWGTFELVCIRLNKHLPPHMYGYLAVCVSAVAAVASECVCVVWCARVRVCGETDVFCGARTGSGRRTGVVRCCIGGNCMCAGFSCSPRLLLCEDRGRGGNK